MGAGDLAARARRPHRRLRPSAVGEAGWLAGLGGRSRLGVRRGRAADSASWPPTVALARAYAEVWQPTRPPEPSALAVVDAAAKVEQPTRPPEPSALAAARAAAEPGQPARPPCRRRSQSPRRAPRSGSRLGFLPAGGCSRHGVRRGLAADSPSWMPAVAVARAYAEVEQPTRPPGGRRSLSPGRTPRSSSRLVLLSLRRSQSSMRPPSPGSQIACPAAGSRSRRCDRRAWAASSPALPLAVAAARAAAEPAQPGRLPCRWQSQSSMRPPSLGSQLARPAAGGRSRQGVRRGLAADSASWPPAVAVVDAAAEPGQPDRLPCRRRSQSAGRTPRSSSRLGFLSLRRSQSSMRPPSPGRQLARPAAGSRSR